MKHRPSMKTLPLLALFVLVAPTGGRVVTTAPSTAPSALEQLGFRGGDGPGAEPGGDWLLAQRGGSDGKVSPGEQQRALAQAKQVQKLTRKLAPEVADAAWSGMGPVNIGGRVTEIAVAPMHGTACIGVNGNQVCTGAAYIATASAGVWRSIDAGATWTRRWPNDVPQAMGAVAVAGDGAIFAGTGEANPGGGSIVWGGNGVYRSRDGGATWQHVGLTTSGAIGRIVVHPTDPKIVYVASAGNLFVPGGERGLYKTTDGGDTWERVLVGANATTGAVDVAIDPVNPNNLLVGMWDHVRLSTHRLYAGPGSGVYRSIDGGASWTRATLPGQPAGKDLGRMGVAFAASNPSRAYALIANNAAGSGVGLWRSNDGGATWVKTAAAPSGVGSPTVQGINGLAQSSYGWWFGKVWVDPRNADRVFVAGLELVESLNAGENFFPHGVSTAQVVTGANQAYPHADQHGMAWDPMVPSRVYLANDGGVYVSEANATAGSWRAAALQGWTQHYSVDISQQNPGRVVSGLQDNMCQRNYVAGQQGDAQTWTKYGLCGDGLQTLVKPSNENIIYGCAQYGSNCSRTLDDGTAFEFLGGFTGSRSGWWVPIIFDPNDDDVMYAGTNMFNRSTDGGMSWEPISDDLTTNPKQDDPNPGYRIYGTITTVAAAKSNPSVLMAGTDDGLIQRTNDGGSSWERLTDHDDGDEDETDDADIPEGIWVTSVVIDPRDADHIYATFSGFRNGSAAPHVVESRDGGFIWDDISGNLPDAPVNRLMMLGNRLVAGTDTGVYLSDDGGETWLRLGEGLPFAPVLDMRHHEATNSLTVSTFGFGIQKVTLPA